jgi:hypothetical protein
MRGTGDVETAEILPGMEVRRGLFAPSSFRHHGSSINSLTAPIIFGDDTTCKRYCNAKCDHPCHREVIANGSRRYMPQSACCSHSQSCIHDSLLLLSFIKIVSFLPGYLLPIITAEYLIPSMPSIEINACNSPPSTNASPCPSPKSSFTCNRNRHAYKP